ncbi:MAG: prepilin-type N-terminal cleavage/methylation domain-containing protein [Sedimentisphaerales bacterium]
MKSKGKIVNGLCHPSWEMAYAKTGFTIIELLTAMSIIVILLSLLLPSLNMVRRYAREVTQKGQFHDISKGLEMFSIDFDGYPDSAPLDADGDNYCGAMKLCEAMVGQDGLGFHPDSVFDDKGKASDKTTELYFNRTPLSIPPTPTQEANLRTRKVKYIEGQNVQIASIGTLFSSTPFDSCCPVLCDVFKRNELRSLAGEKLGMPILYYKADPSKLTHDANQGVTNKTNIYNYLDNDKLLQIKPPWGGGNDHPLYDSAGKGSLFYSNTRDKAVTVTDKPYNPNSYILISAGWDGLYGTRDDVYNFMTK